jgi:hypothetical protein
MAADAVRADIDYHTALHAAVAEGPLSATVRRRRVLRDAALRFRAALPHDPAEQQCVLNALGADAVADCRALAGHPGIVYSTALPPATDNSEFGWLVDALLSLPAVYNVVADLSLREAQPSAR